MRKSSLRRARSTSYVSSVSFSGHTGTRSGRESFSSRKASQIFTNAPDSIQKDNNLVDEGRLQGRIKVSTSLNNPDRCMSVSIRPHDGRFYAVGLSNGTINVYSSKTDNILYTLNNEDKDLPFTNISTTCVRFRPCLSHHQNEDSLRSLLTKEKKVQRKYSRIGSLSDSESFLPPIVNSPRPLHSHRRKSSATALGFSLADLKLPSSDEIPVVNNLVSATFTNGFVKTFNFLTEQCVQEFKEDREILTMEYNRAGSMLATGGGDGCLHVYDVEMGRLITSYEPTFDYDRKMLRTYSIAFHPEQESEFVSGGWNKEIQFHDVRTPNLLVAKVPGPKICGESLSFHSSGKEFCAAAWGKNEGLHIFDYAMKCTIENIAGPSTKSDSISDFSSRTTMRSKKELHFPSSFMYSARYFMDNFIAVCGAFPGSMAIVERNAERNLIASISDLPKSVFSIDTFKSKVTMIVGSEVCCAEIFI